MRELVIRYGDDGVVYLNPAEVASWGPTTIGESPTCHGELRLGCWVSLRGGRTYSNVRMTANEFAAVWRAALGGGGGAMSKLGERGPCPVIYHRPDGTELRGHVHWIRHGIDATHFDVRLDPTAAENAAAEAAFGGEDA